MFCREGAPGKNIPIISQGEISVVKYSVEQVSPKAVQKHAEDLYRNGFFCCEAVISAIAFNQGAACAAKLGHDLPLAPYLVPAATLTAVVFVVYTYFRFMKFIFSK